jgi:uncharacterized surface anchored protein
VPAGRDVSFRSASGDAEAAITPASGSIGTVASASPARPQGVFGRREDVFLAGGPLTSPCFFPAYLPDGNYYFQVTDSTGKTLLSTDVVSERAVTVKGGVIASYAAAPPGPLVTPAAAPKAAYDGKTHTADGKTACGSATVNLMPYADAGSQKAAYVVWLTSAANFDGSAAAVDNVCGSGCFHGFHADLSRTFGFRVEDKKSCEPTFCVSGVKFLDSNGNGARDSGEPGLAGVEIRVADENGVLLSGLSGADGSFQICGLTDNGAFRVLETVPNGYTATAPADRDISRHVFARNGAFIIELCDEDITGLDFGNRLIPNAIAGFKFEDLNVNGARDPGEPGLSGVTILLTPAGGGTARAAVTDVSGNFLFTDVAPGSYVLTEVVPTGFTQTMPPSDGIPVTLASGGTSIGNVFGNFRGILTGTISGVKFLDTNGNGVLDPGEGGLTGVTITLTGGGLTRSVVSGLDGSFSFAVVPFGTYTLSETLPAGFQQTTPPAPGTISATLDFGHQAVTGLLFGNRAALGSISGTKFNDVNGNGVLDAAEPGLSGVTIQLRDSAGQITSVTTDASGGFSFTGLAVGAYTLSEIVPTGFVQTAPPTPGTFSMTLAPGQNATGFLFGNRAALGSIAGTKFNDANGNGARDTGEAGVSGVTIQLRNSAGQLSTATTDASGNFSFTNLTAGAYVLSEVVPAGSVQTLPGGGAGINITLTPGQNATNFLFGNQVAAPASISGLKFNDANGNGVRDTGELALSGVSIQLKTLSGQTLLATTDSTGAFSFTGLAAGAYVLSEVVPAGYTQTAPPAPGTFTVTLAAGQNPTGFLFGNRAAGTGLGLISGTKYLDLNTNGIVDGIDRPQEGIVFVLTDANGVTRQTTSAADGTFSFSNLPPGDYVLSEILPVNFFQTFPGTPTNPGTYNITLAPGQQATGFLFLNKC